MWWLPPFPSEIKVTHVCECMCVRVCALRRPRAHRGLLTVPHTHAPLPLGGSGRDRDLPGPPLLQAAEPCEGLAADDAVGPPGRAGLGPHQHDLGESGWQSCRQATGHSKLEAGSDRKRRACQQREEGSGRSGEVSHRSTFLPPRCLQAEGLSSQGKRRHLPPETSVKINCTLSWVTPGPLRDVFETQGPTVLSETTSTL